MVETGLTVPANAVVARLVTAEVTEQALTYDDIRRRGGPSAATMTKIVKGDGYAMSFDTARKLDAALGFVPGTVRMIATGLWDLDRIEERRKEERDRVVGPSDQHQRPALNITPDVVKGMTAEQVTELEARLVAEAWKARREILGG